MAPRWSTPRSRLSRPARCHDDSAGQGGGSGEGCRMGLRGLVYRLYERRLEASLSPSGVPRHVGVMCDGNRRWARSAGLIDVSGGYREGADKIFELLGALDLLPAQMARVLKDAAETTAGYPGLKVNVAVGYGGRREIADAVRS